MTDRELEARLRALYGNRVPAEAAAPMELRTELVAITRGPSPTARFGGSRSWALLAAAALLGAMLLGGALLAGSGLLRSIAIVRPTDASPVATPVPSDGQGWLMRGWPDYGPNNPAGLYTWDPYRGPHWVHKVPDRPERPASVNDSVELRFRLTTQPDEVSALADAMAASGDERSPQQPVEIPGLAVQTWVVDEAATAAPSPGQRLPSSAGTTEASQTYLMGIGDQLVTVSQGAPGQDPPPSAVIFKATQTWLMKMDSHVVAIDVTSFTDTTAALLAEAEAAIQSIRVTRTPYGEPRLVFELTRGWDSG